MTQSDDQDRFHENFDRFCNPQKQKAGTVKDIGGNRDENLLEAALAALSDPDNLDEEFAKAFEHFAFTHDELEKVSNRK